MIKREKKRTLGFWGGEKRLKKIEWGGQKEKKTNLAIFTILT